MFLLEGLEYLFFSLSESIADSTLQLSSASFYSDNFFKSTEGGLLDPKLGSSQNITCAVCKKSPNKCPGHFGYLKLFLPVFNIGYLKTIQGILQLICKGCSRIIFKNNNEKNNFLEKARKIRNRFEFEKINSLAKLIESSRANKICFNCHSLNGAIKKIGYINFIHDFSIHMIKNDSRDKKNFIFFEEEKYKFKEVFLDPLIIYRLFQNIKGTDLEIIDMNELQARPENLILSFLPIPPNNLRPSTLIGEKTSNEDDLTIKLCDIFLVNIEIYKSINLGFSYEKMKDHWNLLQIECSRYLNSEVYSKNNIPETNQGLYQRLKGKNGRFRGNLSGKRVDFSGRTVISPDPNIFLNQLGLPRNIASKLSYPERVSKFNKQRLERALIRGPKRYPGAINVIDFKKKKIFLVDKSDILYNNIIKEGYIVERHLKNNDVILFNRQPSLHRISILAHRIKIIPGKTFKFNECICKPYNADFDGDEMNIHVPQTQKAKAEALSLMNSGQNLNSPRNGKSQIAGIQDFLSASYILTSKETFFLGSVFNQFFILYPERFQKSLPIPCIIKPKILWSGKQIFSWLTAYKNKNKKIYKQELYQLIEKNYSMQKKQCFPFMCPFDGYIIYNKGELLSGRIGKAAIGSENKISLLSFFLKLNSFKKISVFLLNITRMTSNWFSQYGFSIGINEIQIEKILFFEKMQLFNKIFNLTNAFIIDLFSKKDSELKIIKIFSTLRSDLGDKSFLFKRFKNNSALIMIESGSKGSVINLCQMSNCLGQQSVEGKRAQNGFSHRILPHYSNKKFLKIPFRRGFIGTNFFRGLSSIEYFFHSIAGREGLIDTAVKTSETGYIQRKLLKSLEDSLVHYDKTVRTSSGKLIQFKFGEDQIDPEKILFLCEEYVFNNYGFKYEKNLNTKILNYKETETFCRAHFLANMDQSPINVGLRNFIFSIGFNHKRVTYLSLSRIEKEIKKKFFFLNFYQIQPGTSVGAITAQSIGEPGTQMTLQTFHSAGATNINITTGIVRINEIINASKNVLTPIIIGRLYSIKEKKRNSEIKFNFEKINIGNLTKKIEIFLSRKNLEIEIVFKNNDLAFKNFSKFYKKICFLVKRINKIFKKTYIILCKKKKKLKIAFSNLKDRKIEKFLKIFRIIFFFKNDIFKMSFDGKITFQKIEIKINKEKSFLLIQGSKLWDIIDDAHYEFRSIYTNDICVVFEIFGIEAARKLIISEIEQTFKSHGIFTDLRYISILADIMTYKGEILGINRYGIAKLKYNALVLASFEKTLENLFFAAIKNSKDINLGVSENIILGRELPIGTGLVSINNNN